MYIYIYIMMPPQASNLTTDTPGLCLSKRTYPKPLKSNSSDFKRANSFLKNQGESARAKVNQHRSYHFNIVQFVHDLSKADPNVPSADSAIMTHILSIMTQCGDYDSFVPPSLQHIVQHDSDHIFPNIGHTTSTALEVALSCDSCAVGAKKVALGNGPHGVSLPWSRGQRCWHKIHTFLSPVVLFGSLFQNDSIWYLFRSCIFSSYLEWWPQCMGMFVEELKPEIQNQVRILEEFELCSADWTRVMKVHCWISLIPMWYWQETQRQKRKPEWTKVVEKCWEYLRIVLQ